MNKPIIGMTIHTNIIFTEDMSNEYRRKLMDEIEEKFETIVNEYKDEGMYCSGGKGEWIYEEGNKK